MTVANKTRENSNFQKRNVSVSIGRNLLEADILTDGQIVFVLPEKIVIQSLKVLVRTVSSTGSATVDVLVGATVVANEIAVTALGAIAGTVTAANAYQASGGNVTIKAGAVTPAAGDLVCDLIIEYIELDKHNGEYTEIITTS